MRKELSKENMNEALIKEEIRLFKEKIEWNRYGGKDGLWELAVLVQDKITYNTSITEDVIGHLSWKNVESYLSQIKDL